MGTRWLCIILFLAFCRSFRRTLGDSYASIAEMTEVVNLEMKLGESLEKFVELEKKRLQQIKQFADSVKEATNRVKIEGLKSLENPTTTYALIKRFANGWSELGKFLDKDYSNDIKDLLKSNKWQFPTYNEDLIGAMAALFRLQDTYNISTPEMVTNDIPGCGPAPKLLAEDCFDMGTVAYQSGRYGLARDWLNMADDLIRQGRHDGVANRTEVLEYLAWIEYVKGNPERALNLTLEIVQLAPDSVEAKENVMHYRKAAEQNTLDTHNQIKAKEEETITTDFTSGEYASLCRGDTSKSTPQGNLFCWYDGKKNPLLMIRPVKVEMVWRRPRLFIFRDLLSTAEANRIKEVATPRLRRATVFNKKTGELENAHYRVSKSAWLESEDDEVVARVNRRIGAVTGLEMSTAEPLQIANYGMAGQYEHHLDFGDPGSPLDVSPNGNRVATVLIYLNDVSRGGYTVFTRAKTFVSPSMGDAVFWYNLKRSGKGDYETEHAACPVLCGNKWVDCYPLFSSVLSNSPCNKEATTRQGMQKVANKWLHIRGQEFRRKCSLDPNE